MLPPWRSQQCPRWTPCETHAGDAAARFEELLGTKSLQAISVQDIAERSTLNRATFYDHYTDKFALFQD